MSARPVDIQPHLTITCVVNTDFLGGRHVIFSGELFGVINRSADPTGVQPHVQFERVACFFLCLCLYGASTPFLTYSFPSTTQILEGVNICAHPMDTRLHVAIFNRMKLVMLPFSCCLPAVFHLHSQDRLLGRKTRGLRQGYRGHGCHRQARGGRQLSSGHDIGTRRHRRLWRSRIKKMQYYARSAGPFGTPK